MNSKPTKTKKIKIVSEMGLLVRRTDAEQIRGCGYGIEGNDITGNNTGI